MNNVIAFPQQAQQPQYAHGQPVVPTGSVLPPFPMVAAKIDQYARRLPWYVWLPLGCYVMWKLMTTRRG